MQKALEEKGHEFDVIHLHSIFLWPTWAAARYSQRTQTPYVVSPRGMLVNDLIKRRGYFRKMIWVKLIEKKNLERASAVHATSAVEAEEINRFGFKLSKVSVIPNGHTLQLKELNTLKTQRLNLSNRRKILYLGRLNWKKGIDRLILAMTYVPNVELLIAGNDEEGYVNYLSVLIKKQGLEDRIQFIGYVDEGEKGELFGCVDALVLPSYSENFGNVVLEAMAEKCPVIVTPEVGIAAAVQSADAGLIVPGEPEPLASAIARVCSDESLRIELGSNGRQLVEKEYSWPTIAKTMSGLYSEIIDSVQYGS
jgi:glycosyltransferase involved in cell wall biosynthesis